MTLASFSNCTRSAGCLPFILVCLRCRLTRFYSCHFSEIRVWRVALSEVSLRGSSASSLRRAVGVSVCQITLLQYSVFLFTYTSFIHILTQLFAILTFTICNYLILNELGFLFRSNVKEPLFCFNRKSRAHVGVVRVRGCAGVCAWVHVGGARVRAYSKKNPHYQITPPLIIRQLRILTQFGDR